MNMFDSINTYSTYCTIHLCKLLKVKLNNNSLMRGEHQTAAGGLERGGIGLPGNFFNRIHFSLIKNKPAILNGWSGHAWFYGDNTSKWLPQWTKIQYEVFWRDRQRIEKLFIIFIFVLVCQIFVLKILTQKATSSYSADIIYHRREPRVKLFFN